MKESIGLYWTSYRDGLQNFQTSMEFSSEQEAESHYLTSTLKAAAKVDLDIFLENVAEACPELAIPFKMAKELIAANMEEYERVEKAEGEVKIADFLERTRNGILPLQAKDLDALNTQVRPMQIRYADVVSKSGEGEDTTSNVVSGPGAQLLQSLESSQKKLRASVERKTPASFQEQFTNSFAVIGPEHVGPISAGDYRSGTMYLTCRVYRNESGKYSVQSIDDAWDLKTNAPKPERVAASLDTSLKAQGKEPIDSIFPKVVRATLEIDSGHWYSGNDYDDTSYRFTDLDEVAYDGSDAVLHGNDPWEFQAAWDAVLKERVKAVKKLRGSGP
ncbi:MAG TPA: hypothetical protein VEH29_08340, partial [Acidimicrobiales bacterium]|nr:hypothetical protein [Acidimicrobiales bacterium]